MSTSARSLLDHLTHGASYTAEAGGCHVAEADGCRTGEVSVGRSAWVHGRKGGMLKCMRCVIFVVLVIEQQLGDLVQLHEALLLMLHVLHPH